MSSASARLPSRPPYIGVLPCGPRNAISDVAGVQVGHCTLDAGPVQTGVTVLRPHGGDLYQDKVPAGLAVINGFGKSVGLLQLEELGQLETPIALSNTFAVGALAQAQIRACMAEQPELGRSLPTVNPLVLECNDGYLNDIRQLVVGETHYQAALAAAAADFAQGSVGAGRGMSCFQLKGGIGSASRWLEAGASSAPTVRHTVGALVLANHGLLPQLLWAGRPLGAQLAPSLAAAHGGPGQAAEKGSIIVLLATDAALDARQLRRLAWRAAAGLARGGSVYGHGSGDIALAFSTAYTLPDRPSRPMPAVTMLHEATLDPLFQAAADCVEQAVIHALWYASPVCGRDGQQRQTLRAAWAGDLPSPFQP
jgi:D-aminopeptidase